MITYQEVRGNEVKHGCYYKFKNTDLILFNNLLPVIVLAMAEVKTIIAEILL
ncbi:MAG: hypothetical protein IH594_05270 [Bacteroidales bacterium]|nr:hypothetical protein [Bacteroidales bacterium]